MHEILLILTAALLLAFKLSQLYKLTRRMNANQERLFRLWDDAMKRGEQVPLTMPTPPTMEAIKTGVTYVNENHEDRIRQKMEGQSESE